MTSRIFKSIFFTAITLLLASFIIVFAVLYNDYEKGIEEELKRESDIIRLVVESGDKAFLEGLKNQDGSRRISLIASDGSLIFDTLIPDNFANENYLELEEIKGALSSGEAYVSRYSSSEEGEASFSSYYAVRISDNTVLRISHTRETGFSIFVGMLPVFIIIFTAVMALVFVIAKKVSDSIVKPINELDLKSPERTKIFDELKPIISKISAQNYEIFRQTNELKLKENEFNSITTNMSEGLLLINSRASVVSCNKSAREFFGIEGEVPANVLSINNSSSFREAIMTALSGKCGFDTVKKDDKFYTLTVNPVFHNDNVDGAVIFIIDETEKEARESLRREFTSNISHELKTPLTSISGFAELIETGLAEGEDAKKFASKICEEAKRLIGLVGDIIRLTQLDGGEIPYDGEINLLATAEEVISSLSGVAERADVTLSASGEALCVNGNSTILFEMIYNLADNGIKYNKKGGFVRIKVYSDNGAAVISVKDNGIGIPKDKQDRVFERFFRVDKSHSKEIGGTGLGLSIVKHSAVYHNAHTELISEEGRGTEIIIRFPESASVSCGCLISS